MLKGVNQYLKLPIAHCLLPIVCCLFAWQARAQTDIHILPRNDTIDLSSRQFIVAGLQHNADKRKFIHSLWIPGILVSYGIASLSYEELRDFDEGIKEEIWTEQPHRSQHIDNYLPFVPMVSVYALNMAGIHGKNNLRDRTMLLLLSNLINNSIVYGIKPLSHRLRPDGSSYTSFPSGHTAEAFASAEFLNQEYKTVSPWYGIGGYLTAGAVGYLRLYNNKHWFSDVITGAGIGIFSTKLAYYIYPSIRKMLFGKKMRNVTALPTYQNRAIGFAMQYNFK